MSAAEEFLNPKSMLTPGIAGGLAMSITLPLAISFDLSIKWVALLVSFMLGLVIILAIKSAIPVLHRGVYWILNSLIVFSTCIGGAINLDRKPVPPPLPSQAMQEGLPQRSPVNVGWLGTLVVPMAVAAEVESKPATASAIDPAVDRSKTNSERSDSVHLNAQQKQKYERKSREYEESIKKYEKRWSW